MTSAHGSLARACGTLPLLSVLLLSVPLLAPAAGCGATAVGALAADAALDACVCPADSTIVEDPPPPPPPKRCDVAAIGRPCTTSGGQCGDPAETLLSCLLTGLAGGVCTCSCTPDDPLVPGGSSCPDPLRCGAVRLSYRVPAAALIAGTDIAAGGYCETQGLDCADMFIGYYHEATAPQPCTKDTDCRQRHFCNCDYVLSVQGKPMLIEALEWSFRQLGCSCAPPMCPAQPQLRCVAGVCV